jgi:hypothetical protein
VVDSSEPRRWRDRSLRREQQSTENRFSLSPMMLSPSTTSTKEVGSSAARGYSGGLAKPRRGRRVCTAHSLNASVIDAKIGVAWLVPLPSPTQLPWKYSSVAGQMSPRKAISGT